MNVFLTRPANIHVFYLHLMGKDLTNKELSAVQRDGVSPQLAVQLPRKVEELDRNGFEFCYDTSEPQGKRWGWQHHEQHGYAPGFTYLNDAVRNAYWHHVGLYQDIHRLSKLGFVVKQFSDPAAFYWSYANGNRDSALFPTEEAAWRDALRTDKEVREKVVAHKSQGKTWDEVSAQISGLWDGTGNPPVGAKVLVTPHNVIWGFNNVSPQVMVVCGYHGDFVWLLNQTHKGHRVEGYTTTRTDKVSFHKLKEAP